MNLRTLHKWNTSDIDALTIFIVNLLGAIAAYWLFPKKPCINLQRTIDTQLALFWIRRTHVKMRVIGGWKCAVIMWFWAGGWSVHWYGRLRWGYWRVKVRENDVILGGKLEHSQVRPVTMRLFVSDKMQYFSRFHRWNRVFWYVSWTEMQLFLGEGAQEWCDFRRTISRTLQWVYKIGR